MNVDKYKNLEIKDINLSGDSITILFTNDTKIQITDNGQSCCESRYMTSDDDIKHIIGHRLMDIEVVDGPDESDEEGYSYHEIQFLNIKTNFSSVQFASHNEHNGYYGGFSIEIEEV